MRVVFVWLNNDTPVGLSHGIAVLSAELKAAGHSVELLHVNDQLGLPFDPIRLGDELRRRSPDVVALSFGSNHASAARRLVEATRRELADAWVICGGIHATMYPEEVSSWDAVDVVALGEADGDRFSRLLADLETGHFPTREAGFWCRSGGEVTTNPIAPPVDLDRHSRTMDLTLFDHRRILELKRGWADAHAGRGCPHRCSYCFNEPLRQRYLSELHITSACDLNYVRKRPLEVVLEELEEYRVRYGDHIRAFSFTDDQFLVGRDWACAFFDRYPAIGKPLVFLATAGAIDRDIAERSARAGTYMVRMGVESGNETLRRRVLNRHTPNRVIESAVETLQRAGVNAFSFNMLGIPGETIDDAFTTFHFAASLGWDAVKFSMFWPYPGTPLHQACQREGLIRDDRGFVGNNIEDTPLRWPARQQRLYQRIPRFYDVALNRCLVVPEARHFAALLDEVERQDDTEFEDGGSARLRERADQLVGDVVARGAFAYVAPFPDRYDILLLAGRNRGRPLLM